MRAVPDITMDAQDGTSEAAPLFSGVLDLASQVNGGPVGPINRILYEDLGPAGAKDGIADVVSGNDSAEMPDGTVTVPGFTAGPGYDVASGWGTVYAPTFVDALVAATKAANQDEQVRQQAAKQLQSLESSIQLSQTSVSPSGVSYMFAEHFLPGHPVGLLIDGTQVATLTANSLGAVTYMISPSVLGLSAGKHTVELQSLLLNETTSFTVS
jgi:hypothetical protein